MPKMSKNFEKLKNARAQKISKTLNKKCLLFNSTKLEEEMISRIDKIRKHKNLLFIDIDGTIVNFRSFKSIKIVPRPHLETFLRRMKKHFDIVLYSRAERDHVEFIRQRFCSKHVKLAFSQEFTSMKSKLSPRFVEKDYQVFFVDDNPSSIQKSDLNKLVRIKQWTSDHKKDRELIRIADKLLSQLKISK